MKWKNLIKKKLVFSTDDTQNRHQISKKTYREILIPVFKKVSEYTN